MDTDTPDIVVLDHPAHGIPATEYARVLRNRLPNYNVSLAKTKAKERTFVADAPVVTGHHLEEETLSRASDLHLFACTAAGVNHLPLETFADRGIAVTNASGVHGPNIAEHVLGWILMFTRRLDEGLRRQRRREWRRFQSFTELAGSTVTIVGLGTIGEAIVRRLDGFDVHTIGVRHTPSKGGLTDEVIGYDRNAIRAALTRTDVLVLACPLTDTTRGLIGQNELHALPVDAVMINISRGAVVDTDALVTALQQNRIHGAALDVTEPEPLPEDHPLWGFENVFLTPHTSGHTPAYWNRVADILAENIERAENTGEYRELKNQIV
ncbi:D-2-hydroxyacid dehydrogenase [Halobacteria archaeon AArc-curdl1]|uniref:D-2-hydroxyacid dehydrogenase n=1 Tax=Natronosalvus hydrolyticus TaxID=2979988 RepID=A0AAP3E5W2_9EURY|nr:D-2-hydroxyacid dehydrogenase [Halobacteria archaeon AArc-curdl1]